VVAVANINRSGCAPIGGIIEEQWVGDDDVEPLVVVVAVDKPSVITIGVDDNEELELAPTLTIWSIYGINDWYALRDDSHVGEINVGSGVWVYADLGKPLFRCCWRCCITDDARWKMEDHVRTTNSRYKNGRATSVKF
jgi:hypothetical protein